MMFENLLAYGYHDRMMSWDYGNYFEYSWIGLGLHFLPYLILIIVGIIVYRNYRRKQETSHLDVLKNLYASGKIDEEEYLKRKEVLKGK